MRSQITALVLGLGALARVATAQVPQRLPPTVTADTVNAVTVHNQRNVPVTVYVEFGQFDRRLGVVQPYDAATLRLPAWAVQGRARIQLFVHPEGEVDDLGTQQFALRPPGRIALVVPPRGRMPETSPDTMMVMIPPEDLAEATLTVDNPRDRPVTVYAEHGTIDVRLGQVPARGRATLRFPRSVVLPNESIRIFVHPAGGRDLSSEFLKIQRGQHLALRVPAH
jgi:hypothetical protein